jgi:hypothetical protein
LVTENVRPEAAYFGSNGATRAKDDVVKRARILPEREFVFSATVEIIENGTREAAARQATKVLYVDDVRGS